MNRQKALLMLGILVAGTLAAARTSDGAPSPVAASVATPAAGNARIGEARFTQYCSICHSTGGKGFIGPHIGGINWTTPGLHAIVRGGLGGYGGMPAFNADVVTDRNIADIAAYFASLAPPTPAPVPVATPAPALTTAAPPPLPAPAPAAIATGAPPAAPVIGDAVHGRAVFTADCAACHGASGQGGFGPSLRGERTRKNAAAATAWIKSPRPPMPKLYPDPLTEKDVEDVTAYIESL